MIRLRLSICINGFPFEVFDKKVKGFSCIFLELRISALDDLVLYGGMFYNI